MVDRIVDEILEREGWPQVTNRPSDKGGLTKGGVTYSSYSKWLRSNERLVLTPTEFIRLTEAQAREFLLSSIAGPILKVGKVDAILFEAMFDWATTSGPDDPTRGLQRVLRDLGQELVIDGIYGVQTHMALLKAIDAGHLRDIRRKVNEARVEFYIDLVLNDPEVSLLRRNSNKTQLHNLKGWVRRAISFL